MEFFKSNKKVVIPLAIVLAVVIAFGGVMGIFALVTSGERVKCEKAVEEFTATKPDFSYLFAGATENEITVELDAFDKELAAFIATFNVPKLLYTDKVATLLTRYTAELLKLDLASLKFKTLKKQYPAAYEYVKAHQEAGGTWDTLGTIPFGITDGDKEGFIKAAAAGTQHLGDKLLNVMLCAPSAYNDALVPALEALHIEKMPTLTEFIRQTGLSGSKRMEFLLTRILAIVEPTLESPLTYLCEILPDFVASYRKSCEFINSREKIAKKTGLVMPTIESIVSGLVSKLGMTQPILNLDELAKTGTASVEESGGNRGERVRISGDREVVFAYLAKYIVGTMTYQNNFQSVKKILTQDLKSDAVANSSLASMLTSPEVDSLLASLMDILLKLQAKPVDDIDAKVEAHNSEKKDFSGLYSWPATEETVRTALNAADGAIVGALAEVSLGKIIFTDAFATAIAKITAKLCGMEFGTISFRALSKSFPTAYAYVKAEQAAGKTWDDIDVIPFGIPKGNKEAFIRACGAGSEHFGDALALCLMSDVTSYDNGLLPLLEALHTGPMTNLEEFVGGQGLDSEVRMMQITEKVLTALDSNMVAPLSYLCEMLPDLIASYNQSSASLSANPNSAITLPPINELLGNLASSIGITLPEYDFNNFISMATASTAKSGNVLGKRMELKGDRDTVFMALASYLGDVIALDGNVEALVNFAGTKLGLDQSVIDTLLSVIDTISSLADMVSG